MQPFRARARRRALPMLDAVVAEYVAEGVLLRGGAEALNGVAQALVAALLFGASTPASKWLLGAATPLQLAGLLYLGAALGYRGPVRARAAQARTPHDGSQATRSPRRRDRARRSRSLRCCCWSDLRMATRARCRCCSTWRWRRRRCWASGSSTSTLGPRGWLGVGGVIVAGAFVSEGAGWPGRVAALWVAAPASAGRLDNHLTARIDGVTPASSTFWKGAVAGTTNLTLGLAMAPFAGGAATLAGGLARRRALVRRERRALHRVGAEARRDACAGALRGCALRGGGAFLARARRGDRCGAARRRGVARCLDRGAFALAARTRARPRRDRARPRTSP